MSIQRDINEIGIIPFPILTKEVGLWSAYNFGQKQDSWLGMVEEVGELAHCLLKRYQGIRGFDSIEFFREQFKDALGDIGIYAANYAYNENMRGIEYPRNAKIEFSMNKYIARAIFWLSELQLLGETEEDYKNWFRNLLKEIACIAIIEQMEFDKIVTETWLKVKMRNWKEKPNDGNET